MPVHYLASRGGGAENQVHHLINILVQKRDVDIHFLCRRAPERPVPNQKIWKIGSEAGFRVNWTFIDASRIYNTLKRIGPDVIYQNVGCAYTGIAAFYAKRHKAKLLWHIASDIDVQPELAPNLIKRIIHSLDRCLLNYGIRHADVIAAQTRYQNNILKNRFGRESQAYIPIGHPLAGEIKKKNSEVTVLWVASLKPLKQPELFVKLAAALAHIPKVAFIMMGHPVRGKWFLDLKNQIAATPNLAHIGFVPQSEVDQHLADGHILVNTSRYEGFSNTFVQAWLREVPVVSLNVDPDDVLKREKIGFHSRSFEQLVDDVQTLILNPTLRREMGERARLYAEANHSVDKMADALIALFDSL